jgi:hypothetical protein
VNAVAGTCIDKDFINSHVRVTDHEDETSQANSFSRKLSHPTGDQLQRLEERRERRRRRRMRMQVVWLYSSLWYNTLFYLIIKDLRDKLGVIGSSSIHIGVWLSYYRDVPAVVTLGKRKLRTWSGAW